ncbi:hypothetical protein ACVJGD_008638 [Bradyrhizobium sp. USDA 10063]
MTIRAFKRGSCREQTSLLPPRIEEYIDATNPVRAIDAYIANLDLVALAYNGDIGHIDDVSFEDSELIARFDGRTVIYGFGELDTLVPAYATIDKSQGSEYFAVVILVMTQHYTMLQRNLLYTGVTPGQEAGRYGRSEEGRRHRGSERFGAKAVVEIERVAGIKNIVDADKMRADYECTQSA